MIFQLMEEVFNQGHLEKTEDLVWDDVVSHEAGEELLDQDMPGDRDLEGIERFKQVVILFREAFPDVHFWVFDLLAVEDKVVMRWGMQGTHQGKFLGVLATGKKVTGQGIIIYRLEEQKIREYWGIFDVFGLLQQFQ